MELNTQENMPGLKEIIRIYPSFIEECCFYIVHSEWEMAQNYIEKNEIVTLKSGIKELEHGNWLSDTGYFKKL